MLDARGRRGGIYGWKETKICGGKSDLALDVYSTEGSSLDGVEVSDALASQEIEIVSTFLEQVLSIVINNELACVFIRHESELLSNEAEFDIGLETKIGS